MHAAGQAGVVGAHELLDLEANRRLVAALGYEFLGQQTHIALEVGNVLRRGSGNRCMNDAAVAVELELVEYYATRRFAVAHATTSLDFELRRRAGAFELISRQPAAQVGAALESVDDFDGLSDVVAERVALGRPQASLRRRNLGTFCSDGPTTS